MKQLNSIAGTIISKRNQYKLIISFWLLVLLLATGTTFAGDGGLCC